MAKKFNPFHAWLGFDKGVTKPSHFELFGVQPYSDDPIGFKKAVHAVAKRHLKILESMSEEQIGSRLKLHTRMRRHVVKAHDILLDDKLRAGYLKKLRESARETTGSTSPLATPLPNSDRRTQQTAKVRSQRQPRQKKENPAERVVGQRGMDSEPGGIPMALPLAQSDRQRPGTELDRAESDSPQPILVTKVKPKPKRSWGLIIFCLLIVLLLAVGASSLWMKYGYSF